MKIGYARISTIDQCLDMQIDALKNFGCEQIFTDKSSGAKHDRPGLNDVFKFLREGDTLVVWKLDRLGRSISHLIEMMQLIEKRNASFHSIQEGINTSTSMGKLLFHFIGALADFERGLIMERTRAGLIAARARGKLGGRRFNLDADQVKRMKEIYDSKMVAIKEICSMFKISKTSLYNYIYDKNSFHEKNSRLKEYNVRKN